MEQINFEFNTYLGHKVGLTKMGSQVFKGVIKVNGEWKHFMYNSSDKLVYVAPNTTIEENAKFALDVALFNKGF